MRMVKGMNKLTTTCQKLVIALRDCLAANPHPGSEVNQDLLALADRVVDDAKAFLIARQKLMTFKEFFASSFATDSCWCVVTIADVTGDQKAIVLQWEPANYKWNRPLPVEGREECGVYGVIGPIKEYGNLKGDIERVQLISVNNI